MSHVKDGSTVSREFSLLPKIINGGIAGIVGVSIVFPLDLVKTRLQNQTVGPNGEQQYRNMFDCFKKTYAAEGYFGMYRGSAVNILLVTPEKAIKLAANDMFRHYLTLEDGSLSVIRQMFAGGLAGGSQIIITTPMELLKIQMQDAGRIAAKTKDNGMKLARLTTLQLTRKLLKERGFLGLYRGISATAARDVTFSVIYFPLFATLNDFGVEKPNETSAFWWSFLSGYIAASTAALAVTPLDVVKTRLQTINKGSGERQYSSFMDCVTQTMKEEGTKSFFKGGACRMIVIAPLFGIAQTVYYFGFAENVLGIKLTFLRFAAATAFNEGGAENEGVYVLATVLYFTEIDEDRVLLVTGPLSKEAKLLIKNDLRDRMRHEIKVKVVPAFRSIYDVPISINLWTYLRSKYPSNLLVINLTPVESRKVMENMERRILMYKPQSGRRKDDRRQKQRHQTEVIESNATTVDPKLYIEENFVPNDIFYAVEKRCANWAAGCNVNADSFLLLPSSYYNVPKVNYRPPHKFRWGP